MAQTKHQIQSLLSQAQTEPRRRFGQNFMIDQNLVKLVADAGAIKPTDLVVEVGPGTGTLTEEILSHGAPMVAVEIDRDLSAMLREKFADDPKFELIEADALDGKHAVNPQLLEKILTARAAGASTKLVANLPYNIASPLVIELFIAGIDLAAFTVQKEVADRLRATEKDEAYGPLSVMAQLLCRVEVLRTLPPQAFWPAPKIDSALVRMTSANQLGTSAGEFSKFVHTIFSFRRKTLRKALSQAEYDPAILTPLAIDPQLRPENLSPPQFRQLFHASRGSAPSHP